MSYVCLWIPRSPTGAVPTGEEWAGEAPVAHASRTKGVPHGSALITALLTVAPHVALETRAEGGGGGGGALYWVDARGQPAHGVARAVLRLARQGGVTDTRVGVADSAMAAELAAAVVAPDAQSTGLNPCITVVPPGTDAQFLASHPLTALTGAGAGAASPATAESGGKRARGRGRSESGSSAATVTTLISSLRDVGLETCGDLAQLTRAAVELRFGPPGVMLWRLASADRTVRTRHPLALFPPRRRALPSASLSWDDHVVHDLERLAFVVNRLVVTICNGLHERGEGARTLTVQIALGNRSVLDCPVRAARATASHRTWTRLVRAALERLTLPDGVVGLSLRVEATGDSGALQGDLFDRDFQAGAAVAEALAELVDDGRATIVGLPATGHPSARHPLLERRARWRARQLSTVLREDELRAARAVASRSSDPRTRPTAALALQLLPAPRRVRVRTVRRRTYHVPVHFTDAAFEQERGPWANDVPLLTAAGPDHVSGGADAGAPYAREYFHCLTSEGVLVLLYRDAPSPSPSPDAGAGVATTVTAGTAAATTPVAKNGTPADHAWYVHGWWD